jgi:hypothetical protein
VLAGDGMVRIEVRDPDPSFVVEPRSPDGEQRFGLRIVDSVASQWGVEPWDFGKVTWFELDRGG